MVWARNLHQVDIWEIREACVPVVKKLCNNLDTPGILARGSDSTTFCSASGSGITEFNLPNTSNFSSHGDIEGRSTTQSQ
jgi:hypothetical protein